MAAYAKTTWTTGDSITQTKARNWEDGIEALCAGALALASQAAGDMGYASGAAQWVRLAIGAQYTVLQSTGAAPAWVSSITGTVTWNAGPVTSSGGISGTTGAFSGIVTKAANPAFSALVSANQTNVTGDGTEYAIVPNSELVDAGTNYNAGTGIFTAPVTGKYAFSGAIYLYTMVAGTTNLTVKLVTSNRTYVVWESFPYLEGYAVVPYAVSMADMDAGDTAYVTVTVSGTTKTISVGAAGRTLFSGFLIG